MITSSPWWVALPVAANLMALCLTVGMYENYVRGEQRTAELQQFVRRLGLVHVLIVDVFLVALVLLCRGTSTADIVTTVAVCLIGSTSAATLTLSGVPPTRLERRLTRS